MSKIYFNRGSRNSLIIALLLIASLAQASDVIGVRPLTDKIIMVHFDDGFATYHKAGESRGNESVTIQPLNMNLADELTTYSITSPDDPDFSDPLNPSGVSRKSKGTEFTWICEWSSAANGCVNSADDHAKEHWVYLNLPFAMKPGKTYIVNSGSLAKNGRKWVLKYDIAKARSEAVHVNLLGYDPLAPSKYGYVYHWMGDGGGLSLDEYKNNEFHLINRATGSVAYTGSIAFRKAANNKETTQAGDTPDSNFLGAEVYECDFSDFTTEGDYVLAIDGIGCSMPFKIKSDVYRDAFYTSVRGLYHNRSGIALEAAHTDFTRPAPHNPSITPGFQGRLKYTKSRFVDWKDENHSSDDKSTIEAEILGELPTWGWYQDAGDWDGYFSHMRVPALLMFTYELSPENYVDGELTIPESGNGLPDMLDEAGWLVRYFQRTRQLIMDKGYGSGGIGARVAGDWFGHDTGTQNVGTPSYKDIERDWIVSGEDPFTTFFLCWPGCPLRNLPEGSRCYGPSGN